MAVVVRRGPELLAKRGLALLDEAGELFVTLLEGLRRTWDLKTWWGEFIEQAWFIIRVTSIPLLLIAIPLGATISLQVGDVARQIGAQSSTGALVVAGMVRQIAPLASALLISGAGGSAITSDMGARRIRDELSALEVMGINPTHRLVTPRLWAAAVVSVLLCSLVILSGTAGGFYFNVIQQGVTPGAYFDGAASLLQLSDLGITLFKAFVFGLVAAAVACHMGMTCDYGPAGVGRAVTRATVATSLLVFFLNYVLETLYLVLVPPKI
ncbi:phospholipid/cholesterol/gamma-HCH transport system permease protein [Actinocorallia herbida]|uniref:Phospholipid/cholesterol/gamma-HCH transport system permease protein n=1 Tax=Actinocorallia herbida TaxID=58109 RepID=A0A3N1D897_9ACTN|nr:ABC transporter permease [Actinocorallia herbida]ROO89754.1 phospholipid/cholesterol/gamma-HCH transport system permease protein [Actinocorallia herbida]